MKKYRLIITISILLFVIGISLVWYFESQHQPIVETNTVKERNDMYSRNTNYVVQMEMLKLYKTTSADIVILGDSHSFNANWSEILGRAKVANRGIISDLTSGYLHRMEYVLNLHPKVCFVEGGINDFYSKFTVNEVMRNLSQVVDTLRQHNIIPIFTSTFPVATNRENAVFVNKQVERLNTLLTNYCRENKIEIIDINLQISENGFLRNDMSYDGLHLNATGYAIWAKEIERIIKQIFV